MEELLESIDLEHHLEEKCLGYYGFYLGVTIRICMSVSGCVKNCRP